MTPQQALDWLNGGWQTSQYAKTENGKLGIDVDNLWGFQCMDFSAAYSRFLGDPFKNGDAITLWTVPQPGWELVETPQPGDVHVMPFTSGGVTYGHTGGVVQVVAGGWYSIDQNWFNSSLSVGSPPAKVFHPFGSELGFQRNIKLGGPMAKYTKEQEQVAALMATGSIPGDNYNYPFTQVDVDSDSLNQFLQTWQSRVAVVTADIEQTLAKIATGSPYGKDYNSQFQDKPVLEVLPAMLAFWLGQRQVPSAIPLGPGVYEFKPTK